MKWFLDLFKHECKYNIRKIVGGGEWSRFYIERVCRKCGSVQHKDLRQSSVREWMDGPYVGRAPRPTDNGGVEVVQTAIKKQYKPYGS